MTTAQIVIYSVLLGGQFTRILYRDFYDKEDRRDIILDLVLFAIVGALLVAMTLGFNQQQEQLKGKCPELEKVENVYKIK